jgi:iron uptake system component EfeO
VRPRATAIAGALALLVLSLAAAGCGDKKSSAQTAATSESTTTGSTTTEAAPTTTEPAITTGVVEPPPADPLLRQAVADYKKYLNRQARILVEKTQAFSKALNRGDPESAVGIYPQARTSYERLQAIAVAFGLAQGMDAQEGAVPESEWTGFHRIEKTLFDTGMTGGTEAPGRKLVADATAIREGIETLELSPAQMLAVADALLVRVGATTAKAEEERYSLRNLYAISGNIRGAEGVWKALRPYVVKQDRQGAEAVDVALASAINVVESMRTRRGLRTWDELGQPDIDALVNGADEARAKLADIQPVVSGE